MFPEIKFMADPESRRAEREIELSETEIRIGVVSGILSTKGSWIKLTTGRWGQMGHERIACLAAPQYKQRPWASVYTETQGLSLLCRSVNGSRVLPSCISSGALSCSGWRGRVTRSSSLHCCTLLDIWIAAWMNLSKPMLSP